MDFSNASACTSKALILLLFNLAETSRNQDRSGFALGYLKRLAHTGVFVLHQCAGGRAYLQGDQVLIFDAAGTSNIEECLTVHAALVAGLKSSWESLSEEGQLATNFRHASFVDLVVFLAVVRRSRRRPKKHNWSKRLTELWEQMRFSLVKLIKFGQPSGQSLTLSPGRFLPEKNV